MGLLEERKKQNEAKQRINPTANTDMKLKKLPRTSIGLTGDTHAKLSAMKKTLAGREMSLIEVIDYAVEELVKSLPDENQATYKKFYNNNIQEKFDIERQKGRL